MTAPRTSILKLAPSVGLVLSLGLGACGKASGPTTEPSVDPGAAAQPPEGAPDPVTGQPVIKNAEARPGDVTTCPYSGRTFVVKADDPKVDYAGQSYWLCNEEAAEAVRANPGQYLDGFTG